MSAEGSAGALAGKVAMITGAASGIGRGVARRFVADGARVVGVDIGEDRLRALESELGTAFAAAPGDVREPAAMAAAVAAALQRFGALDILVGNAGLYDGNLALAAIPAERVTTAWRALYEVNVLGQLHAVRAATETLIASRGAIVLTSSHSAANPGIGGGALYTSSKAAVNGLVRQLAHELAPEVRVNGVAPGGTITDLRIPSQLADIAGRSVNFEDAERMSARIAAASPLRLVTTPEDHAVLYALLASDAARALTGVVIESDGGTAVRGGN
jgi:NAD(P)-dependent dehydrogenase (short-subunit alcohol dehydrogenase family)